MTTSTFDIYITVSNLKKSESPRSHYGVKRAQCNQSASWNNASHSEDGCKSITRHLFSNAVSNTHARAETTSYKLPSVSQIACSYTHEHTVTSLHIMRKEFTYVSANLLMSAHNRIASIIPLGGGQLFRHADPNRPIPGGATRYAEYPQ